MQLTEKQKYTIVVLREENYKINEIATKMNINRKTVMKWLNHYEKTKNINRTEGSGGKNKFSFEIDEYIMKIIKTDNDLSIREIKDVLEEKNIMISKSTVHNKLIDNDFIYKDPIKKPLLTKQHRENRLNWAQKKY
jgi:transposase